MFVLDLVYFVFLKLHLQHAISVCSYSGFPPGFSVRGIKSILGGCKWSFVSILFCRFSHKNFKVGGCCWDIGGIHIYRGGSGGITALAACKNRVKVHDKITYQRFLEEKKNLRSSWVYLCTRTTLSIRNSYICS